MIFDKNEKRARALEKKDPEKYRDKILYYRSSSDWFVRYTMNGKMHEEKCPSDYQSKSGAKDYYKIVAGKSETGEQVAPVIRRTTIEDMVDFFIEHKEKRAERKKKKGGLDAARTICKHIKNHIGKIEFDECMKNTGLLQKFIDKISTETEWAPKYVYNICKELKAVFSTWLKKKLLALPNPMDAVEIPDPNVAVMDYVPSHEDYEKIIATGLIEGVRSDVLRLIAAVRYSGFRINEVLALKVSDCCLFPDDNGLPYIWLEISKQQRKTRVPRPIRRELFEILSDQIGARTDGFVFPWRSPPYRLLKIYEWSEQNGRNGSPERIRYKGFLQDLAGVPIRPFHDWRKLVKLEIKRTGVTDKRARDYQGHKSESMDDWYTWFQREDLEAIVRDTYKNKESEE